METDLNKMVIASSWSLVLEPVLLFVNDMSGEHLELQSSEIVVVENLALFLS